MNIRTLRTVLLIQAIEESDRGGEVIPLADRADATRSAARNGRGGLPPSPRSVSTGVALSRDSETFLADRARILLARVRSRSPAVDRVLAVAHGLTWLGRAVLVVALVLGLSMSALDGSRRINILSFPLLGLIAWNLFVYAVLIAARLKSRPAGRRPGFWSGHVYESWVGGRIDSLLRQSTRFNVPLAAGLRRFTSEWAEIVHPLLIERATRLMHVAAAVLAVGLVPGLYVRGIALRYEAGWESTFLGPASVHALLVVLYGPAAAISGLGLPSSADLTALRWTGVAGGGEAATWIHLIALTAALYIVVPRLILASVSGLRLWRRSREAVVPPSLLGYGRTLLLGAAGGTVRETASATPYAYEPSPESLAGLKTLLAATLGGTLEVENQASIRYGEEEPGLRSLLAGAPDWRVLLMTLASTPEAENHGQVIRGLRDSLKSTPLLIVVDTGPFAARMQGDASFSQRLQERRKLWTQFVAGYGLQACVVDLTQVPVGSESESAAVEAARTALWSAHEQA